MTALSNTRSVDHHAHRPVRRLYDWVLGWADSRYALVALGVLAFAESSFFPIPPDVLLMAMALGAPKRSLKYAAVCSIASVAGGAAGYGIGAFAWGVVDQWFYDLVPGFTAAKFQAITALYNSWGLAIVFTAGFSPIPYKLFTISSGVMQMPLWPFLGASAVSRSARFFLVAGLIYRFGPQVRGFIDKHFGWLVWGFAALVVLGFGAVKLAF